MEETNGLIYWNQKKEWRTIVRWEEPEIQGVDPANDQAKDIMIIIINFIYV